MKQYVNACLMSKQDLQDVTGLKRPKLQARWFQKHFGIHPVQRADGHIILTWSAFEALQARRVEILSGNAPPARTPLIPVRKTA